jgi:hypothetical protein
MQHESSGVFDMHIDTAVDGSVRPRTIGRSAPPNEVRAIRLNRIDDHSGRRIPFGAAQPESRRNRLAGIASKDQEPAALFEVVNHLRERGHELCGLVATYTCDGHCVDFAGG